jgi:uracil-DNA glycosylase
METWLQNIPLMQAGYHEDLLEKVNQIREEKTVYPPQGKVLYALAVTPFDDVQAVILGQDPYHGEGQAMGLAFSVPEEVPAPPSLRNIFKEVKTSFAEGLPTSQASATEGVLPLSPDFSTDLTRWAKQGVLLLNAILTVEAGQAASHKDLGWQTLTDEIIAQLSMQRDHLVFMLWGRKAQAKARLIDPDRHLILEAPHPSPLSAHRGFFGCGHFSKANVYLREHGAPPITW